MDCHVVLELARVISGLRRFSFGELNAKLQAADAALEAALAIMSESVVISGLRTNEERTDESMARAAEPSKAPALLALPVSAPSLSWALTCASRNAISANVAAMLRFADIWILSGDAAGVQWVQNLPEDFASDAGIVALTHFVAQSANGTAQTAFMHWAALLLLRAALPHAGAPGYMQSLLQISCTCQALRVLPRYSLPPHIGCIRLPDGVDRGEVHRSCVAEHALQTATSSTLLKLGLPAVLRSLWSAAVTESEGHWFVGEASGGALGVQEMNSSEGKALLDTFMPGREPLEACGELVHRMVATLDCGCVEQSALQQAVRRACK
jgi:hypothetical protein